MASKDFATALLTGDKELVHMLKHFADDLTKKAVKTATSKATTPVKKDATAKARSVEIKDTGLLADSLGKKTKAYKRSGVVVSIVGPRKGFRRLVVRDDGKTEYADPANYAHLVEFGTQPHFVGEGSSIRDDKHSGRLHPGSPPMPFMRPAFDNNRGTMITIWSNEIKKAFKNRRAFRRQQRAKGR